jgi:hypothetical protein
MLKLAGAKDAKEYEEITGMPLPETKPIKSKEDYIGVKTRPPSSVKETRKDFDESALPEAPDMPNKMSEESRKDPAVKDLPKDFEGNIDLPEYIKKREQAKMKNKSYARDEEAEQTRIMNLSSQKSQDKYTLTPSEYKETYGMKSLERERDTSKLKGKELDKARQNTPMTKLGLGLLDAKQTLRQDYSKLSSTHAQDEYARNEQLFEDYEQATQLNIPTHGIDPFQN